jgi:hypothetical protein
MEESTPQTTQHCPWTFRRWAGLAANPRPERGTLTVFEPSEDFWTFTPVALQSPQGTMPGPCGLLCSRLPRHLPQTLMLLCRLPIR